MRERASMTPARLEILLRRVDVGGGSIAARPCVDCPLEKRSIQLEECVACVYCAGIEGEPGGARATVLCYQSEARAALLLPQAVVTRDRFTPSIAERMP